MKSTFEYLERTASQERISLHYIQNFIKENSHRLWYRLCQNIHDENKKLLQRAKQ